MIRRRWKIVLLCCVVGIAAPTLQATRDFVASDSCLDGGGAWYGSLGCIYRNEKVERIVISKSARRLEAFRNGRVIRTFEISLGRAPVGDKQVEGDNRTPEGRYIVALHNERSAYFRALKINYPTPQQRVKAAEMGRDPGRDIMIHGMRNGLGWIGRLHLLKDWTRGCIAITNDEMRWLFDSTVDGVQVDIQP